MLRSGESYICSCKKITEAPGSRTWPEARPYRHICHVYSAPGIIQHYFLIFLFSDIVTARKLCVSHLDA